MGAERRRGATFQSGRPSVRVALTTRSRTGRAVEAVNPGPKPAVKS